VVHRAHQLALHGVEIHRLAQLCGERGHYRLGVVPGPVEPAVHRVLHPPPQRVEQRCRGQCRGGYRHRCLRRQHAGREQHKLGDGTTTDRSTPVQVTGLTGVTQVAAYSYVSLALRSDGTVWAWGDNRAGQLGNARSSTPVTRPVNTIGVGSGITQLSAGDFHVLALKSNGTVLAWGATPTASSATAVRHRPPVRCRPPA
jgi:hypothetical protein